MEVPPSERQGRLGVELAEIAVGGVESRATTPGSVRRQSGATLVAASSSVRTEEDRGYATRLTAPPPDSNRQPSHSPDEPPPSINGAAEVFQAHTQSDASENQEDDPSSPPPPLQSPGKVLAPVGDGSTSGGRTPPLSPTTATDPCSPSPIPPVEKPLPDADAAGGLDVPFPPAKEVDECPICLEHFTDENPAVSTLCGHRFHLACQMSWHQRSNVCPICLSVPPGSESPAFGEIADEVDSIPRRPDPDEAIREHLFALLVASMIDDHHPRVGFEAAAGHPRFGLASHARSRSPSTHSAERSSNLARGVHADGGGSPPHPQQQQRREHGGDGSETEAAYSTNSFSSEESSNIRRHSQNLTRLVRERSDPATPEASRKSGWRRLLCCCD